MRLLAALMFEEALDDKFQRLEPAARLRVRRAIRPGGALQRREGGVGFGFFRFQFKSVDHASHDSGAHGDAKSYGKRSWLGTIS